MADAGRLDLDQNLALARPVEIDFHHLERLSGGDSDGGAGFHVAPLLHDRFDGLKRRSGCAPRDGQFTPARAPARDLYCDLKFFSDYPQVYSLFQNTTAVSAFAQRAFDETRA
jgi:hypothetical protein